MGKKRTARRKTTGFTYSLPAIRSFQAGQPYFTTAIPFGVLAKLLEPNAINAGVEPLDRDRTRAISQYITQYEETYVLPAVTLSTAGDCDFVSLGDSDTGVTAGTLMLPMDASLKIHDGQYRLHAIARTVAEEPHLASETLPVVIYADGNGCDRRFGDIKANQRKSGRAERIISDSADPIANVTREVIANVSAFTDAIEMVKTTISNRSRNLFTFSALYQANEILLAAQQDQSPEDQAKFAVAFWKTVQDAMPDWTSDTPRVELRKQTVHAHGVALCAIATAGAVIVDRYPRTWKRRITKLKSISWSRDNAKLWEGKAMLGGRMTKTAASVELTAGVISEVLCG